MLEGKKSLILLEKKLTFFVARIKATHWILEQGCSPRRLMRYCGWCPTWRRCSALRTWYSTRARDVRYLFSTSSIQYPIGRGQRSLAVGRTLWRYFNAPGNIMFVTTNLVALAGMMSYTTVTNMARERALNEKSNPEVQNTLEEERLSLSKQSPLKYYTDKEINIHKNDPPISSSTQHAKMSLFHLFYSFYMFQAVISGKSQGGNSWDKEVDHLKKKLSPDSQATVTPHLFYKVWNIEYQEVLRTLSRSQQFHLPNWTEYPAKLQEFCEDIHDSKLETMSDFIKIYNSVKTDSLKTLLQAWLYDNSHLFKVTTKSDNEPFYQHLLSASVEDRTLFNRYASILLDASNPRRESFFNTRYRGGALTASLETVVAVLNGTVNLAKTTLDRTTYHDSIIRLVSMIRTNCIISNESKESKAVRVLLLDDQSENIRTSPREKSACYKLVSENTEAMAVLGAISELGNK